MGALQDITLGKYVDIDSPIHCLDPRTKMVGVAVVIAAAFSVRGFVGLGIIALFLLSVILLSRLKFSFVVRGLRPFLFLFSITAIFYLFLTPGESIPPFPIYRINVTYEGLWGGIFVGVRLLLLIIATTLLTLTTSPMALTDATEKFLKPLERVGVPAHEISMMMMIALRFIPTLLGEAERIMKAQKARGADFESGNIFRRVRSLIPVMVPMLVGVFRRADELAIAMEARCYRGGVGRTRLRELKAERRDYIAVVILACLPVGVAIARMYGF
ncbi:MAG: energy-coupling factor transporter transmembrane component T family protein [bacterium]